MNDEIRAAAERLLNEDEIESILYGTSDRTVFEQDIQTVARAALEAGQEVERLRATLEATTPCADLLVRIVRPWYAGPTGDQGLNDPLYGEYLRAIDRYKRTRATLPTLDKPLRPILVGLLQSLDSGAKSAFGVCPVCRLPSARHAANAKCMRNRARAALSTPGEPA